MSNNTEEIKKLEEEENLLKKQLRDIKNKKKKIKDKLIHQENRIFCKICDKNIDKYAYDKHLETQKHRLKMLENK
jgi:hypothetical protein